MNRILMTLILVVLLPTASPGQTPPPPGDPYLCYKAALAKTVPPQAKFSLVLGLPLEDQFGALNADVKGIQSICNKPLPAARSDVHQVGYKIAIAKTTPPQPKFVRSNHTAHDQFGDHSLTVLGPADLRAPSAKVLGSGGTGTVDTTGIDHFECYKVATQKGTPKFTPTATSITDEFGTVNLTLAKITKLCTPVNKNNEAPTAATHVGHLVCYQAKLPKGVRFPAMTVSVNNTDFGPAVLVAKSVAELCVPAFKDAIPTPTPTPTPSGECGDGVINGGEQCDGAALGICGSVGGSCGEPGFSNECSCCSANGELVTVLGCCNPSSVAISFGPAGGGQCTPLRCDAPFTCGSGAECLPSGDCCGLPANPCLFTLTGQALQPCCDGSVCERPDASGFFLTCCVSQGGACGQGQECCSGSCSASGSCD